MPEALFGYTTDIVALTGGLSRNFVLMKFGGCPAIVFFSAKPGPPDFPTPTMGQIEEEAPMGLGQPAEALEDRAAIRK